jgi:hypothetical protein
MGHDDLVAVRMSDACGTLLSWRLTRREAQGDQAMNQNSVYGGSVEPVAVPLTKASAIYGLSRSSIYRAAAAGEIILLKIGRNTLVDAASARAYLGRLPRLTPKSAA